MARKSSNNTGGCGTLIYIFIILFVLSIVGKVVTAILGIGYAVLNIIYFIAVAIYEGFKYCIIPVLIIVLVIVALYKILFYFSHQKPLSYEQIEQLAKDEVIKYTDEYYNFSHKKTYVDSSFKSQLNYTGGWYEINKPVNEFPSYIASLLCGKHHEWVIIGIEKDGYICQMWGNKGNDSKSVYVNCPMEEIIDRCIYLDGRSILRLHNHPNPNPQKYTTLVASDQDYDSAFSCAEEAGKKGLGWFDFICSRDDFFEFHRNVPENFDMEGKSAFDIIDIVDISKSMDYKLQKKYEKKYGLSATYSSKTAIEIYLIILLILCLINGYEIAQEKTAISISAANISEFLLRDKTEYLYSEKTKLIDNITDDVLLNYIDGLKDSIKEI